MKNIFKYKIPNRTNSNEKEIIIINIIIVTKFNFNQMVPVLRKVRNRTVLIFST